MSKNLEHIDQLFKETLQNANIPAPSGAWEAIASKSAVGTASTTSAGMAIVKVAVTIALASASGLAVHHITKKKTIEPKVEVVELAGNESRMDLPVEEDSNVELNENPKSELPKNSKKQLEKGIEENNAKDSDIKPQSVKPIQYEFEPGDKIYDDGPIARKPESNTTEVKIVKPKDKSDVVTPEVTTEPKAEKKLYMFPNVFTPNGGGVNDSFYIRMDEPVLYQLTIKTVNGDIVFVSTDYKEKWDGTYKGRTLPNGIYVIASLVYKFDEDSEIETKSERVKLKRDK